MFDSMTRRASANMVSANSNLDKMYFTRIDFKSVWLGPA